MSRCADCHKWHDISWSAWLQTRQTNFRFFKTSALIVFSLHLRVWGNVELGPSSSLSQLPLHTHTHTLLCLCLIWDTHTPPHSLHNCIVWKYYGVFLNEIYGICKVWVKQGKFNPTLTSGITIKSFSLDSLIISPKATQATLYSLDSVLLFLYCGTKPVFHTLFKLLWYITEWNWEGRLRLR